MAESLEFDKVIGWRTGQSPSTGMVVMQLELANGKPLNLAMPVAMAHEFGQKLSGAGAQQIAGVKPG